MAEPATVLHALMDVITDRKAKRPAESYTTKLLSGGVETIGAKIREEAEELIEAARSDGEDASQAVIHEAADLVYHLLVLLGHCNVTLTDVETELHRRFGTSGLDEKASRGRG